ncbi:cation:proton antiporter [Caldiplasma sukawensis]
MSVLFEIFVLLIFALVLGSLADKFGIPSVVGELLAGLILGGTGLNLISKNTTISNIADVSLFFIVLLIGIQSTTETLIRGLKKGVILTLTSFIIPFLSVIIILLYLGAVSRSSVLTAMAISVPSISIISVIVNNLGLMSEERGEIIISSVILTDIISFIILSYFIDSKHVIIDISSLLIFFLFIFLIDRVLRKNSNMIQEIFKRLRTYAKNDKLVFGSIIILGLIVSSIFDFIGLTYVLGGFFAGILISDVVVGDEILGILKRTLSRFDDSFFIPLFFSISALSAVIPPENAIYNMLIIMTVTVLLGGLLNYFYSRKFFQNSKNRTLVGIMGGRGAVGVIIGTIAFQSQLITSYEFSEIIFATVLISMIMTPFVGKTGKSVIIDENTQDY